MIKKFKENLNTVVFTSKYVAVQNSPIVYVAHHEDGTWEFWGDQIIDESEIMLVALEQIIKIDTSILELADLPIEFSAQRKSKESEWILLPKN
jgi:hypothetical protein